MFIGPSSIELVYLYMYVCVHRNGVNLHTQMLCVWKVFSNLKFKVPKTLLCHTYTLMYVCINCTKKETART